MEPDEEAQEPQIDFISCVCFVPRGVAKENPEKVTLTKEELAQIIKDTKRAIDDAEEENPSGTTSATGNVNDTNEMNIDDIADEYNFDQYDQEAKTQVAAIGDIAVIDENDGLDDNDELDSENEDDLIKCSDNLILVGHVQDSVACLEVYVYNESEGSLYVHHDFLLPAFPLCIEWMRYDPETKDKGNMCAIGGMDPIITVWDLDIQDSLEPTMKFGAKGNRKRNIPKYGHTDAVLTLSWNRFFPHILASGSVDQTVILWDMDTGKPHTTIKAFQEKIQSIEFHPQEVHSQLLLTGSCDGTIKLFDCRHASEQISENMKLWNVSGEIEKIKWDTMNDNCFFAATNHGKLHYFDMRKDGQELPVWSKKMHDLEISGLSLSANCKGLLSTVSADGNLKIWKYDERKPQLICEDSMNIGRVQCMDTCSENHFTLAMGGDFKKKQFRVVNVNDYDSVKHGFGLSS